MRHASMAETHQQVSDVAALPRREQALMDELKDPSISWYRTSSRDRQIWESGGELDPFKHRDRFGDLSADGAPDRTIGGRQPTGIVKPHRHLDWHNVDTQTLRATTESHEILFSKTRIYSFSHHTRQGIDKTHYDVTFISVHDKGQRMTLNGSTYPGLGEVFEEISRRITPDNVSHTPRVVKDSERAYCCPLH